MLRAQISEEHPFVLSLFGCQYHGPSPNPTKADLITTFDNLVKRSAVHVETLEQDGRPPVPGSSRVWMTYWTSPANYQHWWASPEVSRFWASLPDADAGFWCETLQLSHRRSMFETNKPIMNGFAHVGTLAPLTEKKGYWGAYRDRLADATPEDRLQSPLGSVPPPRTSCAAGEVRKGRVVMKKFPDNLCVVVEGQDLGAMGPLEREHWKENFDASARKWISHVVEAGADSGVVSARSCYAPQSGKAYDETADAEGRDWPTALDFNRKVQILYFLDLSYMERIGRAVKTHVHLRKNFMKSYSSEGGLENRDFLLWVELSVVKAQDVEAEYVGCYDGTGFLAYDRDPAFQAQ